MTDSKINVRRSIGPRRTGEGEAATGADPLAELTRFMEGPADDTAWPSRRAAPARRENAVSRADAEPEDAGDFPVRRPIRRQPILEPTERPDEELSGDDRDHGLDDGPAEAEAWPAEDRDSLSDDPDAYIDDEGNADRRGALDDAPQAADDGAPGDDTVLSFDLDEDADAEAADDDPFMHALMQELESDGGSAPKPEAAAAPRVRPSFAFPARTASDEPVSGAGSAAAPAPASAGPDATRSETPAPLPAWRASPPHSPTVRSRATPVAPPVEATMPKPSASAEAERLQHARDHAAISSEADGALEELRSRLARSPSPAAPGGAAPAPTPRPATGWGRPAQPPAPSAPVGERPSFVRQMPAAAPEAPASRPDDDLSEAMAIDEESTVDRGYGDHAVEDDPATDAPIDPHTIPGDEAPQEAGWTLDEDDLAAAIARSVGGADPDDDPDATEPDATDRDAAEAEDDGFYAADEDGDLFRDADDLEGADTSAIDEIDFEFELLTTAPDATADDFRKPSERADAGHAPEPLELTPVEDDSLDEDGDMDAFARALGLPDDAAEDTDPDGQAPAEDAPEDEPRAEDHLSGDDLADDDPVPADEDDVARQDDGVLADADGDDDASEAEADAAPQPVFPELASRGRRAVPSFRFDLKGADSAVPTEPEAPAKPRDRDLDFDLPGFGSPDPWSAWPAGPQQAAKTGATGAAAAGGSRVAEQLEDALFREDPAAPEPPRALAGRPALTHDDWPTDTSGAAAGVPDAADDDDAYKYDDAYYDEAEPEWDADEHGLPPHSLGEMDAALGLAEPSRRGRRKLGRPVAALVLLLLLAGGGYAAYSLLGGAEEAADGPPPVIQADADGVKVMADGASETDGGKTVYDRVGEEPAESGRLVRSQEVPIDPTQSAGVDDPISSPLLPKRVRTVVVRPDGTIIPADELDAAQGQTDALVAPSGADTVSGDGASEVTTSPTPIADTAPDAAGATAQAEPAAEDTAGTSLPGVDVGEETDSAATETDAVPATEQALSPIRTSERIAAPPSPAPTPRPAASEGTRTVSTSRVTAPQQSGPLSLVPDAPAASATTPTATLPSPSRPAAPEAVGDRVSPAVLAAQNQRANQPQTQTQGTQTAAVAPAATPAPAAAAPTGDWAVQVSSQRTADQARAAYQQLQRRFPGVLGGREPAIQSADLGDRGTFYRVRLPTQTRDAANQLCAELKAAGGDCFVGRN